MRVQTTISVSDLDVERKAATIRKGEIRKSRMEYEKPISPHSFEALNDAEKAAAMRAELYVTHKARGSLGTYYYLYPDERPKSSLRFFEDQNELGRGHDHER